MKYMRLTLDVTYDNENDPDDVPVDLCKILLHKLVAFAVEEGCLSGETDLCVEEYSYTVEEMQGEK